jgi:hypothetical protein
MSWVKQVRERVTPGSSDPVIVRAQVSFFALALCILVWMLYWWVV